MTTTKTVPAKAAATSTRFDHSNCKHAKSGAEGKKARAACRKEHALKAAAAAKRTPRKPNPAKATTVRKPAAPKAVAVKVPVETPRTAEDLATTVTPSA